MHRMKRLPALLQHLRARRANADLHVPSLAVTLSRGIPLPLLLAELAFIVYMALSAAGAYLVDDPNQKLPGIEAEWLTSFAYLASNTLHEHGYIPLWQPYLEYGEPLVDNPFSFVLNPVSIVPSLLYGGLRGIKLSVALTAIVAGLGGWFLGRMLGFGPLGRVLLGLLLLGKGNMHAMLGSGYFQLGASQAYFPWIIGGTLGILRLPGRRWPVALTAISFTLLFLAGNVWYTLPMLISIGLLALTHVIRLRPGYERLDWAALGRLALAGALTVGLCAVLLLPLWGNRAHIGDHPNTDIYDEAADFGRVVEQFYNGDVQLYFDEVAPGDPYFYYSFITPPWYALLLFVIIPPLLPFTHRPALPGARRIWAVGLLLVVAMTIWGVGGNPVIAFLYDVFPFLGQWRFIGRALAVATFWLAVLLAMRADGLWRAILQEPWAERLSRWRAVIRRWGVRAAQIALALAFFAVNVLAANEVVAQWHVFAGTTAVDFYEESCLNWLWAREPDAVYLAAYRVGYKSVTPFINHEVRLYPIEAAFTPLPDPPTIGHFDLTQTLPEYGIAWGGEDEMRMSQLGYEVIPDSPRPDRLQPSLICLFRRADPLSYAFSLPLDDMEIARAETITALSTPITVLRRLPDRITLHLNTDRDQPTVVAVQERAYPGWEVWVNGERWRLESVSGVIGVLLPPNVGDYTITFAYRPPLLFQGLWISLFTAAAYALYLLRGDVVLWRAVMAWRKPYAGRRSLVLLLGTGTPNADPERMGSAVAIVISNVYDMLKPYVKKNDLGYVITDGLHCILFPEEGGIRGSRIPDVAYISHERIPEDFDFNRPFPGAPDLAVEVVSPNEGEDTLLAKVRDYLNAGSQQVWVVHPTTKEVHQYRRDTPELIRVYMGDDQIEVDDLFPGLVVSVGAFFEID